MVDRSKAVARARVLVLLNPGRMSRHWLQGIAAGAERLGVLAGTVEMSQIWNAILRAGDRHASARAQTATQLRRACERLGVTHVVSYTHNGVFECGVCPESPDGRPGLFPLIGVGHIMLWSDHPNWAISHGALEPGVSAALGRREHVHIVKSAAAADEVGAVLGWPNVHAMPMGEDCERLRPARAATPAHDAVMIVGDAKRPPDEAAAFLEQDDPEPREIMRALRPVAMERIGAALRVRLDDGRVELCGRACEAMVDARISSPHTPFWRLAASLAGAHGEALGLLRADPRLWYGAIEAMQTITGWRRAFWPAWLARRADVGIYGSPASRIGLAEPPGGGAWVENDRQPEVYGLGRCALNINAAHDEAGLTHKPFQIGASGAACVHHFSEQLEECFTPGDEIMTFERGPELLDGVRRMASDADRAREMGDAMRARVEREHTWVDRVGRMIELADASASSATRADAA